jgi:hypothetical protein
LELEDGIGGGARLGLSERARGEFFLGLESGNLADPTEFFVVTNAFPMLESAADPIMFDSFSGSQDLAGDYYDASLVSKKLSLSFLFSQ